MRFRMRHNGHQHEPAVVVPDAPAPVAEAAPEEASATPTPIPAPFAARAGFHAPLKTQMSGSDVRTERVAKVLRGEIDDLRKSLAAYQDVQDDLTELDLDAVAENPDAAAALPPGVLVRALLQARDENRKLAKRASKQRDRIEKIEARLRELKLERAWYRGRLETLEDVIAALHGNIQDLRAHRDALPAPAGPGPRALHPAAPLLDASSRDTRA